jgi:hypothetical protein
MYESSRTFNYNKAWIIIAIRNVDNIAYSSNVASKLTFDPSVLEAGCTSALVHQLAVIYVQLCEPLPNLSFYARPYAGHDVRVSL